MTLLRVAPEKTSLPVADDVTLGNHGDSGLDGFLQWAALSSYWPMVLEAEVVGGEITALTWHDASLPLDPDPLSQWEQKADHPASHYTGLPDGTYWAIPMSATDWEEAGKRGRELSLRSVTMDPDTMTVTTTDGFSGISLPVAEDVVLGGGETELSDFLNRPDWGTGAVLELEVTGGKITALTAWEARFSVEELAPDGDYIIGNLYDFRAENASGFPICFKARMYEVEEDTWRVTNLIGTSTFRVDEADLCREDGTPYEGGVLSFLNEFCADSDELYWRRHPEPYPFVNRLTLQATVRGGYITSLTRGHHRRYPVHRQRVREAGALYGGFLRAGLYHHSGDQLGLPGPRRVHHSPAGFHPRRGGGRTGRAGAHGSHALRRGTGAVLQ